VEDGNDRPVPASGPGKKGDPEMKIPYRQMLKPVGLAFVLVAAVHFAVPPSAGTSCTCRNISFVTSTFTGRG
jgi:hypothetical protein